MQLIAQKRFMEWQHLLCPNKINTDSCMLNQYQSSRGVAAYFGCCSIPLCQALDGVKGKSFHGKLCKYLINMSPKLRWHCYNFGQFFHMIGIVSSLLALQSGVRTLATATHFSFLWSIQTSSEATHSVPYLMDSSIKWGGSWGGAASSCPLTSI